jgi:hypothetical protein
MTSRRRCLTTAACAVGAIALSACSQVSALAPVGGDGISTLRIAIDDVLAEKGVPVLVSPKCTEAEKAFTCKGTTRAGDPIVATSPAGDPMTMTVSVAGKILYDGDVNAVVQRAAEVGS